MVKLALDHGSATTALRVDAAPKATLTDLLSAAEHDAGAHVDGCAALGNTRTGEQLPLSTRISAADLRDGDVLSAQQTITGATSRTAARVAIVGGPAAHTTVDIGRGAHTVGSGPDAHVDLQDPSIRPGHTFRLLVESAGVRVQPDHRSTAPVYLNGTPLEGPRPVWGGDIVEIGATSLTVELQTDAGERSSPLERTVRRAPRRSQTWEPVELTVEAPPAPARKNRIPLISALLPLLLVPVLWLAGTHGPAIIVLVVLSPLIAIGSRLEERFGARRQYRKGSETWHQQLSTQLEELRSCNERERAVREMANPPVSTLVAAVAAHPTGVWQRRAGDDDFLTVRLGTAAADGSNSLLLGRGGAPELITAAEEAIRAARRTAGLPVTLELAAHRLVAIAGRDDIVDGVARSLVAQLALLHGPADLAIAAAVGIDRAAAWDWLGWLPHTDAIPGADDVLLGAGPVGAQDVLRRLLDALTGRVVAGGPATLLVLDSDSATQPGLLGDLLAAASGRLHIVLLGREPRQLPRECTAVVDLSAVGGAVVHESGRPDVSGVTLDQALDVAGADSAARSVSGLIDPDVVRGALTLPRSIGLLDLIGLSRVGSRDLLDRWASNSAPFQAVIGLGPDGPLVVDLASNHALIGGTTGSGKSELLQTLVCSLAATTGPQQLNFLFIDYKGGAAFRDLVALPHTAGYVTDLEPHLTQRTLISLRAEMRRRLSILDEHRASSIEELERADPAAAPARLVIVVDEFATLVREAPSFIDGIVDLAARGRSVGMRVVLATQRPAGIVTDKMRTNIGVRMSLRVNDEADSVDIIGSRDAAHLPADVPGRGIARLPGGQAVEFQGGYVGATTVTADSQVRVRPLGLRTGRARAADTADVRGPTDLVRLVGASAQAAKQSGLPRPRAPWVRPLPDVLPLRRLSGVPSGAGGDRVLVLGALDDPQRQRQGIAAVDLDSDGHLLVFGAGHSGKTTALRTVAASLAQRCSPDQVQLYGLDFASRGLTALAVLPHVGAVASADEPERVNRVLARLTREVAERTQRFAAAGAATVTEFRSVTGEIVPRLVLLVDGYASMAATYEKDPSAIAALQRIVVDGRPVGVHAVIATERPIGPAGLGALTSAIGRRLVLRLGNESDHAAVGRRPDERNAALEPGRGHLDALEVQVAVLSADQSGVAQHAALVELAGSARERWPGRAAPTVETLAEVIDHRELPTAAPMAAPLGRSFETLSVCELQARHGHAIVLGSPRSGRTTALRTLLRGVAASTPNVRIDCLCASRFGMTDVEDVANVVRRGEIQAHLTALLAELAEREAPIDGLHLLVVDDGDELTDLPTSNALEKIAGYGPEDGLWIIAAAEVQASRSGPSWVRALRRERHGLLLDATGTDIELLGARVPMAARNTPMPGRGFLVVGGTATLVQVAS